MLPEPVPAEHFHRDGNKKDPKMASPYLRMWFFMIVQASSACLKAIFGNVEAIFAEETSGLLESTVGLANHKQRNIYNINNAMEHKPLIFLKNTTTCFVYV